MKKGKKKDFILIDFYIKILYTSLLSIRLKRKQSLVPTNLVSYHTQYHALP